MKRFISLLLFVPLFCQAQLPITDYFDDSDFLANPTWNGDVALYKISTYTSSTWSEKPRLQLNDTVANISNLYLVTPLTSLDDMEWSFWTRLNFNTSTTNNCRVYLTSDNSDLEASLNGYFVLFGDDVSGTIDSISLCRQDGATYQKIIKGTVANTSTGKNYRIKVTRDNTGLWKLYSDTTGSANYVLEGSNTDVTYSNSSNFGVFCRYTSTNKTNFYFDDFYIGNILVDTIAPVIQSISVSSQTEIVVTFDEYVETTSAETTTNYTAAGLGNPSSAIKNPDGISVTLTFGTQFVNGTVYNLIVQNIEDLYSNVITSDTGSFAYYIPSPYDIVINEIMPDPEPAVGIPAYEYIELYNTTAVPVSIKNWLLEVGSTAAQVLPDFTIDAGEYLIIVKTGNSAEFTTFGDVIEVSSLSMTNSGSTITLKNPSGNVIHSISYTTDWYHDANKEDGGYSIEQIDPNNPCGEENNWAASTDILGGTPGSQNSVYASNPDNTAPNISNAYAYDDYTLVIMFDEIIDPNDVTDITMYLVDNGIGTPITATPQSDNKSVVLIFATAFEDDVVYTVTISDTIEDCVGNYLYSDSWAFSMYQPGQFEIVINEIMCDEEPAVGLPEYEYIELYNRTSFPISLSGWMLKVSSTFENIGDATIPANGYIILCNPDAVAEFSDYGSVAEVTSKMSLTNGGTTLTLINPSYDMISSVTYSSSWYNSTTKDDGGWALEQIDPNNPCGEENNWTASNDISGGTPGRVNSVHATNSDVVAPVLVRASVSRFDLYKVTLFFSEALDYETIQNANSYSVDNGIGTPVSVTLSTDYDFTYAVLNLGTELEYDIIYTATIVSDSVSDCVGNLLPVSSSVKFAIPRIPDSGDIVINEILSNPADDGVDYVEIYNRSTHVFDLRELYIGSYDTTLSELTDLKTMTPEGYLIFPEDYVVLTTNPDVVKEQYETPNPYGFAEIESMPSYNNDDGVVTLCTQSQEIIDMLIYNSDMHFAMLSTTDGVSLERINFDRPASDVTNWHSAAADVGYGTPAYKNSQYSDATSHDDGSVTISPDIFSPDNDGYNDVLNITYLFTESGYVGSIVIYDAQGRLIRNLVTNELLGITGTYSWDGITEDAQKANVGIYVVLFEVYDLNGNVKKYKATAVLGAKLQ